VATWFRPPTAVRHFDESGKDPLMSRVPYDVGYAVVDNGGTLTPFPGKRDLLQDEVAAATHVYYGGCVNGPLSAGEVANLTSAGYGAYLSTVPP